MLQAERQQDLLQPLDRLAHQLPSTTLGAAPRLGGSANADGITDASSQLGASPAVAPLALPPPGTEAPRGVRWADTPSSEVPPPSFFTPAADAVPMPSTAFGALFPLAVNEGSEGIAPGERSGANRGLAAPVCFVPDVLRPLASLTSTLGEPLPAPCGPAPAAGQSLPQPAQVPAALLRLPAPPPPAPLFPSPCLRPRRSTLR